MRVVLDTIERVSWPDPGAADQRAFGPAAAPASLEVIIVDNDSHGQTRCCARRRRIICA